jgi:short-subunit dehydrogenase
MNYAGKTALITGASSGIGQAFAVTLAQKKMNLVLVARSESKLKLLASQLHNEYGIKTETISVDLSKEKAGLYVYEQTHNRNLAIDMLINNAGFSTNGKFETIPLEQDHQQVMLNVVSIVDLTHAFISKMLEKGEGAIINVGSTTSFYPLAYQAVYAASKAFVLSFSEALWVEYQGRGIKVLALCPGATDTQFFQTMGRDINLKKNTPEEVVRIALLALEKNRNYVIPGFRNNLESLFLPRLLPRAVVAKLVGSISQKIYR